MSPKAVCAVAMVWLIASWTGVARGVVIERSVTPEMTRHAESRFTVKAERHDDGLFHFTITYRPHGAKYIVAATEIRDREGAVIAKSSTPMYVEGPKVAEIGTPKIRNIAPRPGDPPAATIYIAVAPQYLAGTRCELSERDFSESDGQRIPMPGGIDYQIKLSDFAQEANHDK